MPLRQPAWRTKGPKISPETEEKQIIKVYPKTTTNKKGLPSQNDNAGAQPSWNSKCNFYSPEKEGGGVIKPEHVVVIFYIIFI